MNARKIRIGLVAPAVNAVTRIFISNVVQVLLSLTPDLHLITANAESGSFRPAQVSSIRPVTGGNAVSRVFSYIRFQLQTAFLVARLAARVDFFIFFLCEELFLPVMTARLLRKNVVLSLGSYNELEFRLQKNTFHQALNLMRRLNFALSTAILVYSPNVIRDWGLEKYRPKIAVAHEHFLDFNTFKLQRTWSHRDSVIGYIGRLSEEKGVFNLVAAVPQIVRGSQDLKLMLVGEGHLKGEIEQFVNQAQLHQRVELTGWIPHEQIPVHLNNFKLLVLPSYTEGLPNIMLEAMACGTPVLATPVGSISQFIEDGQTGFIMENNSPECIAKNVLRALQAPDLKQVGLNGLALVENEFTFAAAVKGYREVVDSFKPREKN